MGFPVITCTIPGLGLGGRVNYTLPCSFPTEHSPCEDLTWYPSKIMKVILISDQPLPIQLQSNTTQEGKNSDPAFAAIGATLTMVSICVAVMSILWMSWTIAIESEAWDN